MLDIEIDVKEPEIIVVSKNDNKVAFLASNLQDVIAIERHRRMPRNCREEEGCSGTEMGHSQESRAERSCRDAPDHAPAWAFCPTTSISSLSPGRALAGHRSTTSLCGPSWATGPGAYPSSSARWTCSRRGSAASSTNSSGRRSRTPARPLDHHNRLLLSHPLE
jgi:hypothetical protein